MVLGSALINWPMVFSRSYGPGVRSNFLTIVRLAKSNNVKVKSLFTRSTWSDSDSLFYCWQTIKMKRKKSVQRKCFSEERNWSTASAVGSVRRLRWLKKDQGSWTFVPQLPSHERKEKRVDLPSRRIPILRHFLNLQYWHWFRWCWSIGQLRFPRHEYVKFLRTERLKNDLQPINKRGEKRN